MEVDLLVNQKFMETIENTRFELFQHSGCITFEEFNEKGYKLHQHSTTGKTRIMYLSQNGHPIYGYLIYTRFMSGKYKVVRKPLTNSVLGSAV
jgi:hypothetical protein